MTRFRSLARSALIAASVALAHSCGASAERVLPSDQVSSRVVVRGQAQRSARDIGSLRPGESADLLEAGSRWHQIRLDDGSVGFVSTAWTRLVPDPVDDPGAYTLDTTAAKRGLGASMVRAFRRHLLPLVTSTPRVNLYIEQPALGRSVHRHHDPRLPVAGVATTGSEGNYDVMLVIDVSTSTNEFAETDVNEDGVSEDRWRGRDSILQAQVRAARNFVKTLRRLPGNREGRRIRVGLVSFAGDDRYHLLPEDRDFDPTPDAILALAKRDAELQVALTRDYESVDRALRRLASRPAVGMTDFAAGVARALVELAHMEEQGAVSEARHDAQKVIQFLTDGKPRLPYDRDTGEWTAIHAAKLAASHGVRINTFALGRNAVTRRLDDSLKRMAARSGGRIVELEHPGDIVKILEASSFAYVDRIKLVNRSTQQESDFIGTAIDGSFYGEIPLREGDNELRVVAVLHDDRESSETLHIRYEAVPPDAGLARRLQQIRGENEALIEEIRERLMREMEATREQRERSLELAPEQRE